MLQGSPGETSSPALRPQLAGEWLGQGYLPGARLRLSGGANRLIMRLQERKKPFFFFFFSILPLPLSFPFHPFPLGFW